MSTVNIVMATYQGERFLAEQIESILNSGYTDWCLYISDDGSTDRTVEIARSYEMKYPERIRVYVNEENCGCTRNFLGMLRRVAQCAGEGGYSSNVPSYYMFCDQDDVWMPDKIERTLHCMIQMEKKYGKQVPAAVFTDVRVVDENLIQLYRSFYTAGRLDIGKLNLAHILMENKLIGCTVMMNGALIERITELPEHARYHDWWVAILASAFGHIGYYPEATMYYRQHGNNVIGAGTYGSYVRKRLAALKEQKEVLLKCQRQAEEFYRIYQTVLSERAGRIIREFATLHEKSWLVRRVKAVRYGYFKTGLLRNIGVMILL